MGSIRACLRCGLVEAVISFIGRVTYLSWAEKTNKKKQQKNHARACAYRAIGEVGLQQCRHITISWLMVKKMETKRVEMWRIYTVFACIKTKWRIYLILIAISEETRKGKSYRVRLIKPNSIKSKYSHRELWDEGLHSLKNIGCLNYLSL